MSIEIHCTNCSQHVRVKSKYAGKRVHCPHCQHLVEVPETDGGSECGSSIAMAAPLSPPLPPPAVPPPAVPPPAAPPPVELRPPVLVSYAAPVTRKPRKSGLPVWIVTTACSAAIVFFSLVIYAVFTMGSGTGPFRQAPANQQTAGITSSSKSAATTDASAARPSKTPRTPPTPPTPIPSAKPPKAQADGISETIPAAKLAAQETEKSSPTSPADTADDPAMPAADVGAVAETSPLPDMVDFRALPFEHPATSMAMTEDGRYLVVSHQTADQLTI